MSNMVLCERCEKITKSGGKRSETLYEEDNGCKECRKERFKKVDIRDYLITLNSIRKLYGK